MEMTRPYQAMDSPRSDEDRALAEGLFVLAVGCDSGRRSGEATAMPPPIPARPVARRQRPDRCSKSCWPGRVGVDGLGSGGGSGGVGIGIIRGKDAQCAATQVTAATIRMVTNSLLNLVFIMEPSVIFCFIPRPSVKALLWAGMPGRASILSSDCGMVAGRTYPAPTASLLSSNQGYELAGRRPCSNG